MLKTMLKTIFLYILALPVVQWMISWTGYRFDSQGRIHKRLERLSKLFRSGKPYPLPGSTPPWEVVYDEWQKYYTIVHAPTGTVVAENLYDFDAALRARWLSVFWPFPVLTGRLESSPFPNPVLKGLTLDEMLDECFKPEQRP